MIGKREMQKITITEKLIRNENEAIEAIKANMPSGIHLSVRVAEGNWKSDISIVYGADNI